MTTKLANGVVVIYPEDPRTCERCQQVKECRPVGPDGAQWCFKCATEVPGTLEAYSKRLFG